MYSTKYVLNQEEVEILHKISCAITGKLIKENRENILRDKSFIQHDRYLCSLRVNDSIQLKFSFNGCDYDFETFFTTYVENDKYNDFEILLSRISGKPIVTKFEVENQKTAQKTNSFLKFISDCKSKIVNYMGKE